MQLPLRITAKGSTVLYLINRLPNTNMYVHIKNWTFDNILFPEGGCLGTFKLLLKIK